MPAPTSPPVDDRIDPRIRQRRIEVRRQQGRRRLRAATMALVLVSVGAGGRVALRSPLLDVDRVQVRGATHTPTEAVVAAAGVRPGRPMIDVDERSAESRIRSLVWVQRARVRRQWPATVTITVAERRPSATTRTNGEAWAVLDSEGQVLEVVAQRPEGLVELEGVLGPVPTGVQPGARATGVAEPLEVVRNLPPALAARTASVAVVHSGEIALKLNPRGTVRLGEADNIRAKVRAIETVLASLDTENLAVLDVRLPSSPVLTRG